jgi:hypothetical protein
MGLLHPTLTMLVRRKSPAKATVGMMQCRSSRHAQQIAFSGTSPMTATTVTVPKRHSLFPREKVHKPT